MNTFENFTGTVAAAGRKAFEVFYYVIYQALIGFAPTQRIKFKPHPGGACVCVKRTRVFIYLHTHRTWLNVWLACQYIQVGTQFDFHI